MPPRTSREADFKELERALRWEKRTGGVMMTPERMVIELHLTPRRFAAMAPGVRQSLRWYTTTYAALVRHNLLPRRPTTWDKWLRKYRASLRGPG